MAVPTAGRGVSDHLSGLYRGQDRVGQTGYQQGRLSGAGRQHGRPQGVAGPDGSDLMEWIQFDNPNTDIDGQTGVPSGGERGLGFGGGAFVKLNVPNLVSIVR